MCICPGQPMQAALVRFRRLQLCKVLYSDHPMDDPSKHSYGACYTTHAYEQQETSRDLQDERLRSH